MNEFTPAQLLERVTSVRVAPGTERVRQITQRIVSDLFRTIEDLDVGPDEFWRS